MEPIQTTDFRAVSIHNCWPIGVYDGRDESVIVRRPRLTDRGTRWMRTVWRQRVYRPQFPNRPPPLTRRGEPEALLLDFVDGFGT